MRELAPVKGMVDEAQAIFPAYMSPFATLLSVLCSGETSARAVWKRVCEMPLTALLHRRSDPNLSVAPDGSSCRALGPLEAVDSTGLTVPEVRD